MYSTNYKNAPKINKSQKMIFEGLHAIYYNHFDLPRARTHTHTHTLRKFVYTKVLVSAGPCSKCKAGSAADGGVPLDSNGRCAFFCSPKGYCGKSQAQWAKEGKQFSNAYGVGTDCSAPGDRTHTHALYILHATFVNTGARAAVK